MSTTKQQYAGVIGEMQGNNRIVIRKAQRQKNLEAIKNAIMSEQWKKIISEIEKADATTGSDIALNKNDKNVSTEIMSKSSRKKFRFPFSLFSKKITQN